MSPRKKSPSFSLVVSVYNEQEVLPLFWKQTEKVLKKIHKTYEILFVDDGSTDKSRDVLKTIAKQNKRVRIIHLSRNFGHEAAMLAGIDHSRGHAIICMDADLQHPPAYIPQLLGNFAAGNEIINMVRLENHGIGWLQKAVSSFFYSILNKLSSGHITPHASDFFLISRRIADLLKSEFRERARFLRGFIQIIGFKKTTLPYIAPKRAAGISKYSFWKLWKLSMHAMSSFSTIPLQLGTSIGALIAGISVFIGLYSVIMKLLGYAVPGYTTIVVLITMLFAIQLFVIGVIGQYLGLLFIENKKRPIYLVEAVIDSSTND